MGASSSQPFHSSQSSFADVNAASSAATPNLVKRAPHYTPTMDDEAASQQLMSEARATHATDYEGSAIPMSLDGALQGTVAKTPESGTKKARKPRRRQLAASQTDPHNAFPGSPPTTYSLKELQAFVGPSPSKQQPFSSTMSSTQIEVPDTQTVLQPNRVSSSTPLTSTQTLPTGSSSNKRSKKRKKNMNVKDDLDHDRQGEDEGSDVGIPSAAQKARKPRMKEQPSTIQTKDTSTTAEQDTIPATPYEEAVDETSLTLSNTTEGRASRKRRRKNKSRTSVVDLSSEEVSKAPTVTRNEATDVLPRGGYQHAGILDTDEEPSIPTTLPGSLKAEKARQLPVQSKLKEIRKPQSTDKKIEAADTNDGVDAKAGLLNAAGTATPIGTPCTKKGITKRRRTKEDKQAAETPLLDWEPPVRSLDETPTQAFNYDDSDEFEAPPEDDNRSDDKAEVSRPSRKRKSTNGTKASRASVGGLYKMPSRKTPRSRANPNRNYQRDRDDDDRTAAERALDITHELGQPPDKRTGGEYTADEKELLRRAIRDYQERNCLETADLVEIIQWNHVRKKDMGANTTDQTEMQYREDSIAFWDDVKSAGLLRNLSDVKKHVRTQYHMCQRGHWSQDEDKHLRELASLHPGNWKLIATHLNRLELDVYNRWKDYVRHGENRITKRWNVEEEENFVKVLSTVCQRVEDHLAETGKPPLDDYTPVINWHEVCKEMGDTRSRLQCQSKWKLMRAREPPATVDVEIKPRKVLEPGQVEVEVEVEESKKKRRKSKANKERDPTNTIAESSPPGPEDMLWGDKVDLIANIVEQMIESGCESDDQIIWQDVALKMNQTWSVRSLQTVYKELLDLVGQQKDFKVSLSAILAYIDENHRSEVEERYVHSHDLDVGGSAPLPNSSKKRKRESGAGSSSALTKRSKALPSTSKAFKSKELITDSDNAESEPEL